MFQNNEGGNKFFFNYMPNSALFSNAEEGNNSGLLSHPPHKTVIVPECSVSKGFVKIIKVGQIQLSKYSVQRVMSPLSTKRMKLRTKTIADLSVSSPKSSNCWKK